MSHSMAPRQPPENLLLAALPPAEYDRLRAHMDAVPLTPKRTLYEPGTRLSHVYFPTEGVVSLLAVADEGATVEVATVGNESMVGLPVFLGAETVLDRAIVQIPGAALRMPAAAFVREVTPDSTLHVLLHRYTHVLMATIERTVACNRFHSLNRRCCRWLLMTHDRVAGDTFPLTQEFLAQMLGVRRATVTDQAGLLQQVGLIRYHRGVMTILDRRGLEEHACECYGIIRAELDRLRA